MDNLLIAVAALGLFFGGIIGWRLRGRDNRALATGGTHCSRDDVEKRARRAF